MAGVEFDQLVEYVADSGNQWGKDKLAIWGGTCRLEQIADFLTAWNLPDNDGCIWETDDSIGFAPRPNAETTLERARIFGTDGDLSLRRHTDHFLWHFVGKPGVKPPKLPGGGPDFATPDNDFWRTEPNAVFLMEEKQTLFWGARKGEQDRWFDDRVAWADLAYPIDVAKDSHTRPQLTYRTFSREGRVEFVWYLKMEAKDESG
jgi:hypothetical protein